MRLDALLIVCVTCVNISPFHFQSELKTNLFPQSSDTSHIFSNSVSDKGKRKTRMIYSFAVCVKARVNAYLFDDKDNNRYHAFHHPNLVSCKCPTYWITTLFSRRVVERLLLCHRCDSRVRQHWSAASYYCLYQAAGTHRKYEHELEYKQLENHSRITKAFAANDCVRSGSARTAKGSSRNALVLVCCVLCVLHPRLTICLLCVLQLLLHISNSAKDINTDKEVKPNEFQNIMKSLQTYWNFSKVEKKTFKGQVVHCSLYLVADYSFFRDVGYSDENHTKGILMNMVRGADANFRATDFDGDEENDKVGFLVANITVHQNLTYDVVSDVSNKNTSDYDDFAGEYLNKFSMNNFSTYCLAIAFTSLPFNRPPRQHIQWNASSTDKAPLGGICEQPVILDGQVFSYNTMVFSYRRVSDPTGAYLTNDEAVEWLTIAISFSFGGLIENFPIVEILTADNWFRPKKGMSVRKHSFVPCVVRQMLPVIVNKGANCMLTTNANYCGNGVIEEKELCDCGPSVTCVFNDKTCVPKSNFSGSLKTETPCTIRQSEGFLCSPLTGECCSESGILINNSMEICNRHAECEDDSFCAGEGFTCPIGVFKANGTACRDGVGYCEGGQCTKSVCIKHGLRRCNCRLPPTDRCKLCCVSPVGFCQPADNFGIMSLENSTIYLPLTGFCAPRTICSSAFLEADDAAQLWLKYNPLVWLKSYFIYILFLFIMFCCGVWTFSWAKMKFYNEHIKSRNFGKILGLFRIVRNSDIEAVRSITLGRYLFERFESKLVKTPGLGMPYTQAVARMRTLFPTCPLSHLVNLVIISSSEDVVVRVLLAQGYPLRRFAPHISQSESTTKGILPHITIGAIDNKKLSPQFDFSKETVKASAILRKKSSSSLFTAGSSMDLSHSQINILWANEFKQLLNEESYSPVLEEFKVVQKKSEKDFNRFMTRSRPTTAHQSVSNVYKEQGSSSVKMKVAPRKSPSLVSNTGSTLDLDLISLFSAYEKQQPGNKESVSEEELSEESSYSTRQSTSDSHSWLPALSSDTVVAKKEKYSTAKNKTGALWNVLVKSDPSSKAVAEDKINIPSMSDKYALRGREPALMWKRATRGVAHDAMLEVEDEQTARVRRKYKATEVKEAPTNVDHDHYAILKKRHLRRKSKRNKKLKRFMSDTEQESTMYGVDFVEEHMKKKSTVKPTRYRKKSKKNSSPSPPGTLIALADDMQANYGPPKKYEPTNALLNPLNSRSSESDLVHMPLERENRLERTSSTAGLHAMHVPLTSDLLRSALLKNRSSLEPADLSLSLFTAMGNSKCPDK